ncbi:MAG: TetR/AcrR family transcriptional regulator [Ktedonobacteraceae bacterium]
MPVKKQQKDTDTTIVQPTEEARTKGTPSAEETRTRILDAAQCLFAAQGFDATPTKAIAEQAGVPNGLIFYYFPTKKTLLETLIAERNMLPDVQAIVQAPVCANVHATLVTLGKNYLKVLKQHEELSRIMLREFRSHEDIAENFKTLREEQLCLIAAYMDESMRVGGLQPVKDVQVMARVFLYNLFFVGLVDPLSNTPRFIEDMVDLLLCGIVRDE